MLANWVLLVDDEDDTRELTALLLDHASYEMIVAADLASGIAISRQQPDIGVIMADMYLGRGQTERRSSGRSARPAHGHRAHLGQQRRLPRGS